MNVTKGLFVRKAEDSYVKGKGLQTESLLPAYILLNNKKSNKQKH